MQESLATIKRALISVHDKSGIEKLARVLVETGVEIISSGGTASALESMNVPVTRIESITGSPEMLGGRVKTLHPLVHGGILANRLDTTHLADVADNGIGLIDLVVVNLYPFEKTVSNPDVTTADAIEEIDIGGPAMIRAAAKNHAFVGVVISPQQYPLVIEEMLEHGGLSEKTRLELARAAFARTAAYDAAIASWLQRSECLPEYLNLAFTKEMELRYGENPQQRAAYYAPSGQESGLSAMKQLGGKALSYNNIGDLSAAWNLATAFTAPATVIVKHANPCGVAVGESIENAYRRAYECDPQSAFGGVVAFNRMVSGEAAEELSSIFTEVVVAPAYDPDAIEILKSKKNLRIMEVPVHSMPDTLEYRSVLGGLLLQTHDELEDFSTWKVVSRTAPDESQWADLEFAWIVCAHTKSNAIVLAREGQAVGIGAGDQSRVGSVERAASQAAGRARGGVCASEAFLPFRDALDAAVTAGVRAVVEPGGSVRDDEVIAAANEHGIALVFTGRRHFRHG